MEPSRRECNFNKWKKIRLQLPNPEGGQTLSPIIPQRSEIIRLPPALDASCHPTCSSFSRKKRGEFANLWAQTSARAPRPQATLRCLAKQPEPGSRAQELHVRKMNPFSVEPFHSKSWKIHSAVSILYQLYHLVHFCSMFTFWIAILHAHPQMKKPTPATDASIPSVGLQRQTPLLQLRPAKSKAIKHPGIVPESNCTSRIVALCLCTHASNGQGPNYRHHKSRLCNLDVGTLECFRCELSAFLFFVSVGHQLEHTSMAEWSLSLTKGKPW